MKKIPVLIAIVAVAIVAYSMTNWSKKSKTISASNKITTETRSVKEFDKINVENAFEIDITYSSKEEVSVEAPDNMQQYVDLIVKSGTLNIKMKGKNSYTTKSAIKVHISTSKLNGFELSGASSVHLKNTLSDENFTLNSSGASQFKGDLDVKEAEIELDGASSVILSGTAALANLIMSGASQVKDYDFKAKNVTVEMSGASSARITSLSSINGDVSGASSLDYKGEPAVHKVSVSGAASVDSH